jgi:hypothetical protein
MCCAPLFIQQYINFVIAQPRRICYNTISEYTGRIYNFYLALIHSMNFLTHSYLLLRGKDTWRKR